MRYVIEFWGHLPSVNHLYGQRFGKMYLKKEGKEIKECIVEKYRAQMPLDQEIGYVLEIHGNWYNKGGKTRIKKRDSNNLLKLILDACTEALGIDDSQIFREEIKKVQSTREGFKIEFYILEANSL